MSLGSEFFLRHGFRVLLSVAGVVIVLAIGLAVIANINTTEEQKQATLSYDEASANEQLNILDDDGDSKPDVAENTQLSTDRLLIDSDKDGMPDAWESSFGLDPNDEGDAALDPDRDGLTNSEEFDESVKSLKKRGVDRIFDPDRGLDPLNPDKDGDLLPDGWEVEYGLDPLLASGLSEDLDGDGLINFDEYKAGSNPTVFDTDGDGLADGAEVLRHGTNPADPDTDHDEMPDWWEIQYRLIPTNPNDRFEDPDKDGLMNLLEFRYLTDPYIRDTDNDLMPDGWEAQFGLDPTSFSDGLADPDADGLANRFEYLMRNSIYQQSTDPLKPDSDGDGLLDGEEALHKTNPFRADTDVDGLTDGDEIHLYGTSPLTKDTDGDQLSDGVEIFTTKTRPTLYDTDSDQAGDGEEYKYWLLRKEAGKRILEQTGTVPQNIRKAYPAADELTLIEQMGPFGDPDKDGLTNLLDEDSDADNEFDGKEMFLREYKEDPDRKDPVAPEGGPYHPDPANSDTDGDKMPDGWEIRYGLNPLKRSDAEEDADNDGIEFFGKSNGNGTIAVSPPTRPKPANYTISLAKIPYTNYQEFENNTKPRVPDSDCDLMPDGWEAYSPHQVINATTGAAEPSPSSWDANLDPDDDGFDMDGDGFIAGESASGRQLEERFTNVEEWFFYTNPKQNNTDDPKKKENFTNDGTEVYFAQRIRFMNSGGEEPTVGLRDNGNALLVAAAQTRKEDPMFNGCIPDYSALVPMGVDVGPPGRGPGGESGPPPGSVRGVDIFSDAAVLIGAALAAGLVLRRVRNPLEGLRFPSVG